MPWKLKNWPKKMYVPVSSKSFPLKHKVDTFVSIIKSLWLRKLEEEVRTEEQIIIKIGEGKIVELELKFKAIFSDIIKNAKFN